MNKEKNKQEGWGFRETLGVALKHPAKLKVKS
jgi:hypothetical protein